MILACIKWSDKYHNHVSGHRAQITAAQYTRVAPASAYNTVSLLHFLTGHMVECDFLLLVLPLIARLDLFRIFQKTTLWWTSGQRHLIVAVSFCAHAALCLLKACLCKSIHMLIVTLNFSFLWHGCVLKAFMKHLVMDDRIISFTARSFWTPFLAFDAKFWSSRHDLPQNPSKIWDVIMSSEHKHCF